MLGPLLGAALDNALRAGDAALTGPVSRGDAGTVAGHLRTLSEHAPDSVAGYAGAGPADRRPRARRRPALGRPRPARWLDVLGGVPRRSGGAPAADGPALSAPARTDA